MSVSLSSIAEICEDQETRGRSERPTSCTATPSALSVAVTFALCSSLSAFASFTKAATSALFWFFFAQAARAALVSAFVELRLDTMRTKSARALGERLARKEGAPSEPQRRDFPALALQIFPLHRESVEWHIGLKLFLPVAGTAVAFAAFTGPAEMEATKKRRTHSEAFMLTY